MAADTVADSFALAFHVVGTAVAVAAVVVVEVGDCNLPVVVAAAAGDAEIVVAVDVVGNSAAVVAAYILDCNPDSD